MADFTDVASEYEQKWLQAQIDEHAYQLRREAVALTMGECRNCQAKLDDGRAYCDKDCLRDFSDREQIAKRQWRHR